MVTKVEATDVLKGTGLNISDSVIRSLVGAGKKSKIYAVWAISWDLRVPDTPSITRGGHMKFKSSLQEKQWKAATKVRVRMWKYLKHEWLAQQHHQSFWLFTEGVDTAQQTDIRKAFNKADIDLRNEGLAGSRWSLFPLVTTVAVEKEVEDSFRGNITDDLGRLTASYDQLNSEYTDVQSIGDDEWKDRPAGLKEFDTKEQAFTDLRRKGKRLADKLRTYIDNVDHNTEAMNGMTPEERKSVNDQIESLKRNLPVITGEDI